MTRVDGLLFGPLGAVILAAAVSPTRNGSRLRSRVPDRQRDWQARLSGPAPVYGDALRNGGVLPRFRLGTSRDGGRGSESDASGVSDRLRGRFRFRRRVVSLSLGFETSADKLQEVLH
jgi:hypothetical protein